MIFIRKTIPFYLNVFVDKIIWNFTSFCHIPMPVREKTTILFEKRFHWIIQGSDPERPGPVVSVLENFLGAK